MVLEVAAYFLPTVWHELTLHTDDVENPGQNRTTPFSRCFSIYERALQILLLGRVMPSAQSFSLTLSLSDAVPTSLQNGTTCETC